MQLSINLALALVVTVLVAVGAVGFADKTQEIGAQQTSPTLGEQHKMGDGSTMEGTDHEQPAEQPAEGMDHSQPMEGMDHSQPMEGMNH